MAIWGGGDSQGAMRMGDSQGAMRMAKVDMLGRGELHLKPRHVTSQNGIFQCAVLSNRRFPSLKFKTAFVELPCLCLTLTTHTPLIKGVEVHPLN